jgi:hypothetical protein
METCRRLWSQECTDLTVCNFRSGVPVQKIRVAPGAVHLAALEPHREVVATETSYVVIGNGARGTAEANAKVTVGSGGFATGKAGSSLMVKDGGFAVAERECHAHVFKGGIAWGYRGARVVVHGGGRAVIFSGCCVDVMDGATVWVQQGALVRRLYKDQRTVRIYRH